MWIRVASRKGESKEVSSIINSAIHPIMSISPSEVSRLPKLKVTEGQDEEITETKVVTKGPVNIYGNTEPGNLQRDHRLFWSFS